MEPRIELLAAKKLVGMHALMTLADDKTRILWSTFMPRKKEISNTLTTDLISMQTFEAGMDFRHFNEHTRFEKWAAAEVADFSAVPAGMDTFVLPGGMYAVFLHKGGPATGAQTFQYIFGVWLPASSYVVDDRPHFELLGERYKGNDPESEEEIWIPIKKKY